MDNITNLNHAKQEDKNPELCAAFMCSEASSAEQTVDSSPAPINLDNSAMIVYLTRDSSPLTTTI